MHHAPNANDSNSQDANLRLIVLLIVRQVSIVPIPEPDLFICADTLYMLPYTSTLTTYMTRPRLSVWSSGFLLVESGVDPTVSRHEIGTPMQKS